MAKSEVITVGGVLLFIAAVGYFWQLDSGYTFPQVHQVCISEIGQIAQYWFGGDEDARKICNHVQMVTFGIYGSGIIGLILIIVGAVVPGKNRTWICEFCNYAASTEAEMINHKNRKHLEKKSGYICEHCAFIGRTEGELLDHYNDKHPEKKK